MEFQIDKIEEFPIGEAFFVLKVVPSCCVFFCPFSCKCCFVKMLYMPGWEVNIFLSYPFTSYQIDCINLNIQPMFLVRTCGTEVIICSSNDLRQMNIHPQ